MSGAGRAFFNAGASLQGNVNLTDNSKVILGTGDDLEIYHDGSNSYIEDAGTGSLIIKASDTEIKNASDFTIAKFRSDGNTTFGTTNDLSARLAGHVTAADEIALLADASNTSYTNVVFDVACNRNTSNGTYTFIRCQRRGYASVFFVNDSGNVTNTNNLCVDI